VVSMGDVAASGGYWISMASDAVLADPATITGSIGVFVMLPTGKGLMGKVGIHTGGYRTTWLAGAYDPRLTLDPRMQALAQTSVEHIYSDFLAKVAQTRQIDLAHVDALAQGRIWTGAQAQTRKLVDRLGSFDDAVNEARQRVAMRAGAGNGVDAASLPIRYLGSKPSVLEAIAQKFLPQGGAALGAVLGQGSLTSAAMASGSSEAVLLGAIGQDLQWLQEVLAQRQPFGAVAHCLCQVMP
jgi:protease-4